MGTDKQPIRLFDEKGNRIRGPVSRAHGTARQPHTPANHDKHPLLQEIRRGKTTSGPTHTKNHAK